MDTRPASAADLPRLLELLPQLADFDVPARRNPYDLWTSDAALLTRVIDQEAPLSFAEVGLDSDGNIVGVILVTLRAELLSHAPSAHLEAIAVTPAVRGRGYGRALLAHAEACAKARGAESLTLHVFANNRRARALYDAHGYDSELIRAIKWLD